MVLENDKIRFELKPILLEISAIIVHFKDPRSQNTK